MPAFMEPFRIKAVEPISFPSRQERAAALSAAGYNLFRVPARVITIDLLTDSGTGAMSAAQWSALVSGDESYAGARSFERFESVVRELTGYPEVLPVHQGRAAERILLSVLLGRGTVSLSNTHFDTTRASVEAVGAAALDLPIPVGASPVDFAGDIDLDALEHTLDGPAGADVRCVVLTITNNASGGQPVSVANATGARRLCDRYGIALLLDASRFAENAYLITARDPARAQRSPREAAQELFALADGCWASLKKDGIGNIGGLIALRDADLARRCREALIQTEGFPTYGGLAGRDLDALAQGLQEVTDLAYLRYRAESAEWLAASLEAAGMPVVRPVGCHAVYVDAAELVGHPPHRLPATALANELYLAGGVRVSELGTLVFGRVDPTGGPDLPAPRELVRFALPRRVYTRSHLDYVAEVAADVVAKADTIPAYRILEQADTLRHFTAVVAPMT